MQNSFVCVSVSDFNAGCLDMCTLHSILNPGPECADHQPRQRVPSAGCGCRAATLRSAPGHSSGKDTHNYVTTALTLENCSKRIDWLLNIPPPNKALQRTFLNLSVLQCLKRKCKDANIFFQLENVSTIIYLSVIVSADCEEHPVYADVVKFGPLSWCSTGHLLAASTGHTAGNSSLWQTTAVFLLIAHI